MHLKDSVAACNANVRPKPAGVAASLSIVVALAGVLSTASCTRTEAGLQRETQLYLVASNATETIKHVVPYVPPPANSVLEGVLAVGGALLALWATHLHRSVGELRNGKPPGQTANGPAALPPVPPPKQG
jgi:hypothetical protein